MTLDNLKFWFHGDCGFGVKRVDERGEEGMKEVRRFPDNLTSMFIRMKKFQSNDCLLCNFRIEKVMRRVHHLNKTNDKTNDKTKQRWIANMMKK